MSRLKVLFISSEAAPFAKSGGLGDVIGSLPGELTEKGGIDARVMLPLYKEVKDHHSDALEYLGSFETNVSWRYKYCGIYKMEYNEVTFYFLDNEEYFYRDGLYGYYDDAERFIYFSRASLDCLMHIDWKPDILHCSEWQTGLVPVYLKTLYKDHPEYCNIPCVFTIHNINYQGQYGMEILDDLVGLPPYYKGILEFKGDLNFLKGAIVTCDRLTTVSPTYAEEINYSYYAHGLENIIRDNRYKLTGILNGIDTKLFNPYRDKNIAVRYSKSSTQKKVKNKTALQEELGLKVSEDTPLIGMVTRLVPHKGISLVSRVFDEMMGLGVQFVILGNGNREYEDFFRTKDWEYDSQAAAVTSFSPDLASRIYAGSDMFLMPSVNEPCGLAQMIALRYGSIPIVRLTGGLVDSIKGYNPETKEGNGITFGSVNAHEMLDAVQRALSLYKDKKSWKKIMENAFRSDVSWGKSMEEYKALYESFGLIKDDPAEDLEGPVEASEDEPVDLNDAVKPDIADSGDDPDAAGSDENPDVADSDDDLDDKMTRSIYSL